MNDEILLVQNESGKFEKYEPYAEIVCNTEAESDGSGAFYPGDEDASYVSFGVFVNAWMPLPKVYRREETES